MVEARTDGKAVKAGQGKGATLKRPSPPKAVHGGRSAATGQETEIARLTRERDEALEQQKATSEVLRLIASSTGEDLQPVFGTLLANATRLCEASYGALWFCEGNAFRIAALHGDLPQAFIDQWRSGRVFYPNPDVVLARVAASGLPVQVADLRVDASYLNRDPVPVAAVEVAGIRTLLVVPMFGDKKLIGEIAIYRKEVRPFTDEQIELVKNFAAQAIIAIENTRLLNELRESLQQQTATADVLKVISRSTFDLRTVLNTLVESAGRLCQADRVAIRLAKGGSYHQLASYGFSPEQDEFMERHPLRPDRGSATGRVVFEGKVVHIVDAQSDPEYTLTHRAEFADVRTVLGVPLLREGIPIGVLILSQETVRPFTDKQIELVQTFADQAVIAIENVRLFDEVQARTRELTESLEQQTATAEVLRVISCSPGELEPVFQAMLANAVRICEASFGVLFRFEDGAWRAAAMLGVPPAFAEFWQRGPQRPGRQTALTRVAETRQTVHIADVTTDPAYVDGEPVFVAAVNLGGFRTILVVPMLKENELIGAFAIYHQEVRPFTDKQVDLVRSFASQAVIAIENTRLLNELRESLQQQTATADVLKVISRSTFDLQAVLQVLIENATRLAGASRGFIFRFDGQYARLMFSYNAPTAYTTLIEANPIPPGRGSLVGRTLLERRPVHIPDALADSEFKWHEAQQLGGFRSMLGVPMMREGKLIGVIAMWSELVKPFTDKQIELATTFADQAVIAIENVRLFDEVQTRTRELSQSVKELRALGEVSQAVNSTLDVEMVLTTIVAKAVQLSGAEAGAIYTFDPSREQFRLRATHGMDEAVAVVIRDRPIGVGETAVGKAAADRTPVQIADALKDPSLVLDVVVRAGYRALLVVPMLRADQIIGALVVRRKAPGEFPKRTVELLQTFADQSVLAIQHARLFHELDHKSRELEIASQHKSQFLANMSHELRTPLNAILGYTELMVDNVYGAMPDKMRNVMQRIETNGRHLLELINDVLDLSKIEAGRLNLALADYSLKTVVETVYTAVEPLAQEKNLAFKVDVAPSLPLGHGDERRLVQVLLNLVSNAIKFTDRGEVAIKASDVNGSFEVAVRDTGPGISVTDQAKLFHLFQQADNSITRKKGGTGLGLAISKRIVEMHGGRIWMESSPGHGSTFAFRVPVTVKAQARAA